MTTPTVRGLTPDDAERYVVLRREMLADAPWAFGASPGFDRGSDVAGVRDSLGRDGYAIVAAEVFAGGPLVAAVGVRREDQPKRRHIAGIWGVYVTPGWRGKRLANAVMVAAIDIARTWPGVEVLQLSVSVNSPAALRLYESLGFVAWGNEPDCLRVDGRSFAEIHMWRRA